MKDKKLNKHVTAYFKDWLYNCYNKSYTGGHKFHHDAFYRELKLNCLTDVYKEIRPCIKKFDNRSRFMILPSLEDTREHWNDIQDYKYDWGDDKDDYVYTDCLLSDDD